MPAAPHTQSFFGHPLALLGGAFAFGIFVGSVLHTPIYLGLILSSVASLTALASLTRGKWALATVSVTFAFLFAGATYTTVEQRSVPRDGVKKLLQSGAIASSQPVEVTGVLSSPPETAPSLLYLTLRVERIKVKGAERTASGVVSLLAPIQKDTANEYEKLELRYGARIRVMTSLRRTDNFRNPGVSSFTEYLERKGFDASGFVKSPLLIERLEDERVFLPFAWLYDWRRQIQRQINSLFSAETAGVLNASLLGNRYYLSHSAAERFRDGGTFHVLVISGLHISVIGGVVFLLARRMTRKTIWQFVLSTVVLWSYAIAVGAEVSVVRAALTFTIMTFGPVVSRKGFSLNSLGAAALLLLVWRPKDLFDPSFQLTFLSVLAIVVLAWPLLDRMSKIGSWRPSRETPYPPSSSAWFKAFCELLFWRELTWKRELARLNYSFKLFKTPWAAGLERYHLQRFLRYAFGAFVVALSVQLMLLPLLILYFHRLSLASLPLNMGVSILMGALAIIAIAGLAVAQLSSVLATPLLKLADLLNWLMVHSVDPFASLGIASLRLPEYSGPAAVIYTLYYIPLAILAVSLSSWNPLSLPAIQLAKGSTRLIRRIATTAFLLLLAAIVSHPFSAPRPDGKLHISFLDVGQGDAALVTLPDGTTLLIDGGGRPNFTAASSEDSEEPVEPDTRGVGESVVSEYLWQLGMDRLDYIVATHADADHIDGLNDIARNFMVRGAFVARAPSDDPEFAKFSHSLRARAIPLTVIGAGDHLRFGSLMINVCWPLTLTDSDAPSGNDESLVLQLRFGNRTILMTGDVEKQGEASILEYSEDLRADVVKVGHHGSRTSSTQSFVAAVRPMLAIVSVGSDSVFGHPHPEVVERWKAIGAQVLTTGESGTITITTDGRDLKVTTYVR